MLHLDRHGSPRQSIGAQTGRDGIGKADRFASNDFCISQVGLECLLVADRTRDSASMNRSIVFPLCQCRQVRAVRRADGGDQLFQRHLRQVAHGVHIDLVESTERHRTHSPQRFHTMGPQEFPLVSDVHHPDAEPRLRTGRVHSRLRRNRGELCQGLVRSDADGTLKCHRFADGIAQVPGDLGRWAEQPVGTGDVQKGLVQRNRFHVGCDRLEDFRDCRRGFDVAGEVRRDDDGPWAQPARLCCRHRRVNATRSRFVAGRCNDPAPA